MDPNELRDLLLDHPAVTEEQPFGPDVIVYKVLGKMYALSAYESPLTVNLKCEPNYALELRNQFEAVNPGFHMNKKHWNTVTIDGSISKETIQELIQHSCNQVVKGMTKKDQEKVKEMSKKTDLSNQDWRKEFLRDISE
jgi:predicted DNA-binding protein (MmcQ/YjbR family)